MNKNAMETDVDHTDVTPIKEPNFPSFPHCLCVLVCIGVRVFPINGKGSQGSQAPEGPGRPNGRDVPTSVGRVQDDWSMKIYENPR